jgi:hypothetical protein
MFEDIFDEVENMLDEIINETDHMDCGCNDKTTEEGKVAIIFNKHGVSKIHNNISEVDEEE